jgi:hypothetical protein
MLCRLIVQSRAEEVVEKLAGATQTRLDPATADTHRLPRLSVGVKLRITDETGRPSTGEKRNGAFSMWRKTTPKGYDKRKKRSCAIWFRGHLSLFPNGSNTLQLAAKL